MTSKIKQLFEDYKEFYLVFFILISAFLIYKHWNYNHPCVRGHYETREVDNYAFINDTYMYVGSSTERNFICDCRTTRDSLQFYKTK